jgi:hypothetical protein
MTPESMMGDVAEVVDRLMNELRLTGAYRIYCGKAMRGSFVGRPSDDDVELVLTIQPMGPLDGRSQHPIDYFAKESRR